MIILGIETSCDETALAIVEVNGNEKNPEFKVLGNVILSQIHIHKEYGGVFPNLAKREHAKNLTPLFEDILKKAGLYIAEKQIISEEKKTALKKILEREPDLYNQFIKLAEHIAPPKIDTISVTYGPGLEPALWVGINFSQALKELWNIPVLPINHMEGHIIAGLFQKDLNTLHTIEFPALALLISGGHTELVLVKDWLNYEIIGQTRDDAVGEAFDKVARILGLPYPGGPEISKLAGKERTNGNIKNHFDFPRPMLHSPDFDFSFSGLKTSVLYTVKKIPEMTEEIRKQIAREFEDAVVEVLLKKTEKALEEHAIKTLILGGGVSMNKEIRKQFSELSSKYLNLSIRIPEQELTTDNALMIALAGAIHLLREKKNLSNHTITAHGNAILGHTL